MRRWRTRICHFHLVFLLRKNLDELRKLHPKKDCEENDISIKIIKENLDIVSSFVYSNFNNYKMFGSTFPSYLKNSNITPILKKKDRFNIVNFHPVGILSNLSKVYEKQLTKFFQNGSIAFAKVIVQCTAFSIW